MLNMIKMDLYRMFRTKSMYIVWIVLAVAVLFTTFLCKTDYDSLNKEDAAQQEQFTEPTAENINVGMMVTLPTEPGEKVTVYDIFYANSQGKFYALFLVIFAVLFSTADIGSGYIKNIGGQVQKRGALIFSRSIALAVFMALTMTGAFILQAVANYIVFGDLEWGDPKAACSYFLTELVLHYARIMKYQLSQEVRAGGLWIAPLQVSEDNIVRHCLQYKCPCHCQCHKNCQGNGSGENQSSSFLNLTANIFNITTSYICC